MQKRPFWNARNMLLSFFLLTLPVFSFTIMRLIAPVSNSPLFVNLENSSYHSYYPTSIPWIDNSRKCENSGRSWEGNKCWDNEHSPNF